MVPTMTTDFKEIFGHTNASDDTQHFILKSQLWKTERKIQKLKYLDQGIKET